LIIEDDKIKFCDWRFVNWLQGKGLLIDRCLNGQDTLKVF